MATTKTRAFIALTISLSPHISSVAVSMTCLFFQWRSLMKTRRCPATSIVSTNRTRRPLLILHSGFDGSAEEVHGEGARAGVERGWNVLTFDGPGQYGPIHRERLPFRPDWEKVVTPVVDFALTLSGIDPERIALMGVSLGGELAPRAAAFEKRLAALIANDGLYDFAAPVLARVPPDQRADFEQMLKADQAPALDQALAGVMKESPTARWAMTHGMYVFGVSTPR